MSRKRDNSPSISFFSFQDIITSVTGIMFLVVLILILMLLMRQNYTEDERREMGKMEELARELEALKQRLAASVSASEEQAKRLKELERLNVREVPRRIQELNSQLAALEKRHRESEERRRQMKQRLEELKRQEEKLAAALADAQTERTAREQEDKTLEEELAALAKKKETVRKTVRFTWQKTTRKTPLLIECGKAAISIGLAHDTRPLATFRNDNYELLLSKLLKALKAYAPDDYYIVLLVKPGAFAYAEMLTQELRNKGYDRGREVLPSDDAHIFPEEVTP